jgi:hypothetical protein
MRPYPICFRRYGVDPRVMSLFDLHVPNFAPNYYDVLGALDYQVKVISAASRGPRRFADLLRWSDNSIAK